MERQEHSSPKGRSSGAAEIPDTDGYIYDVPYTRGFYAYLAPAWLDHVALISGFSPPSRKDGFTWCELGCGQGVTGVVLSATHPRGVFHCIDKAPLHIDHGRELAAAAGVSNISFHCADFSEELDLPEFDYVVAHGVYSWVGAAAQEALRRFIDRRLKPGGLVFLSYNSMPGWAADVPFQHLVRTLGQTVFGDNVARVREAAEMVRRLLAAGVPALTASPVLKNLDERWKDASFEYLAHEYMGAAWRPLWFSEVREGMAGIGLAPAGSATLIENFDSFVLGESAREMLSQIADNEARELVREFFLSRRFRRDVFIRDGQELAEEERLGRLWAGAYMLTRPPGAVEYTATTAAGKVCYDNLAARAIVDRLAAGPRALTDIDTKNGIETQDLLANALVLCGAGHLRPVESSRVSVKALNRAILSRLEGPEWIDAVALPCGTALRVGREILRALKDGAKDAGEFAAWAEFLDAHALNMSA